MNNDMLLPAVLGITIGLMLVVVAGYRSQNAPRPGAQRRATATALLIYAVLAVPYFVGGGMTIWWLLGLLVVVAAALATALRASRRSGVPGRAETTVRAVVGIALTTLMLIAAAQTIALLTRIDPRAVVVVLTVVTGLLVGLQGLAAADRIGSVTTWILIVPIAISLALGFFLGGIGEVFAPIVTTPGPSLPATLGVAVAVLMLAWADPGLWRLTGRLAGNKRSVTVVLACALVIVLLIALGQLMFLGGAVLAPSMEFFVVPSNIDILPALAAVLLAVVTMVFAALVAIPLAGVGTLADPGEGVSGRWVAGGGAIAALLALVDPGADSLMVMGGLAGAALLGAQVRGAAADRGIMSGLGVAVVAVLILTVIGQLTPGWVSILAMLVVAGIAAALTSSVRPQPAAEVPSSSGS